METSFNKYVLAGAVKEENKASESNIDDESCCEEIVLQVGSKRDDGMKPASPSHKNLNGSKQGMTRTMIERSSPESESRSSSTAKREQLDGQLESTRAEMDEVIEENQRLKTYLEQILKDYRTLQMQYREVVQHDTVKKYPLPNYHDDESTEEHELIALSLGRTSRGTTKDEGRKIPTTKHLDEGDKQGLTLALDCKFDAPKPLSINEPSPNPSPENSVEELKEEGGEIWPSKPTKNPRDGGDDEISQHNPAKRARVSVRVRCDTPTMNDGCQWRKYGQKIAKGNPCPRAYYRCTVAPSCPVRKQVQRCAEDMSILITTYEGTHNHQLPTSATAMASTTSAAAAMLLSGSSNSGTGTSLSSATPPITSGNLNGLNVYLSDNSRSKPFYLPNSSISSSPSFPTITLDLTSSSSLTSSTSSHLTRLSNNFTPRYSTTNLNFSSLESNPLPIVWSNGVLSYGSNQPVLNKSQTTSSLSFGPQPHESLYQSYLQKSIINPSQQSLPSDTIAAATKAITSDPSFQNVLAAALSSIIGSSGASNSALANQNGGEKSIQTTKTSEPFPNLTSLPSPSNATKCAPSFLTKSASSTSSQPSGLTFLSPPFGFSNSKNKPNTQADNRDHLS